MNDGTGNFLSGFLSSFGQNIARNKEAQRQEKMQEDEKKARLKLIELQIDREADAARKGKSQELIFEDLRKKFSNPTQMRGPESPDVMGPPVSQSGPPPSLSELLSNPDTAMQMAQSGLVDIKDLMKPSGGNMALLQQLIGGQGGQGGTGMPGGMELSGFKLDGQGNPMLDFSRREIKRWEPSADGREQLGLDALGNVIARRPAGGKDRAEEDQPLPVSALADMRDANGNMLQPGTTLRQAQAMGAKTAPKPTEAGQKNVMLLQGMKDAEQTIGGLSGDDTSSLTNVALSTTPFTKLMTTESFRKYEAAGKRWAQNYLYLKSGAQASDKEVEVTFKTYFPQVGDSEDVKAQKAMARMQEMGNVEKTYQPGTSKPKRVKVDAQGNIIG